MAEGRGRAGGLRVAEEEGPWAPKEMIEQHKTAQKAGNDNRFMIPPIRMHQAKCGREAFIMLTS
jgi:hypothetical protein